MPSSPVYPKLIRTIAIPSTPLVRSANISATLLSSPAAKKRCKHSGTQPRRNVSQVSTIKAPGFIQQHQHTERTVPTALARLTTAQLARNIILGRLLAYPRLFRFSLSILKRVASPQARLFNPDHSLLVKAIVRLCIYDQFCAGENAHEVAQTVSQIKSTGYSGVILCPSREITVGFSEDKESGKAEHAASISSRQIEDWKQSHLTTLSMLGENDYMGMKFTGAGQAVFDSLAAGADPSIQLLDAMDAVCSQAAAQNSRIWIDAEEQKIQPTIDRWTVDLMRKYNAGGTALVSNTYQAYLKKTPSVLENHLRLAQQEGWALGIKLVRGAYIGSEERSLIHDTKSDTDRCYDTTAEQLITKTFPGFTNTPNAPDVFLMLAGHNANSIHRASDIYEQAMRSGKSYTPTRWAQLQGMADEVACDLLHQAESSSGGPTDSRQIYKCLQWGTVGDCMQFLIRRATENNGAAERIADSSRRMMAEMRRRVASTYGWR